MLKRMLTCGLLVTAPFLSQVEPVSAGPNASAKILLHLLAPTTKNACDRAQATPDCSGIVTAGGLSPQTYFAYLLVTDADSTAGVAGLQCGIAYNGLAQAGVDVFSWTNCATLEFPSTGWPASGGGNLITWDATTRCQRFQPGGAGTGVSAVAGYFYCAAYGPDTLRLTARPIDSVAKVAACSSLEDVIDSPSVHFEPSHLGFTVFSTNAIAQGYSPCGNDSVSFRSPPGDGGGQAELLRSSGYDPEKPRLALPFTIQIGPGNALLVRGELFEPGDWVAFSFDDTLMQLEANGIGLLSWKRGVTRSTISLDAAQKDAEALANRLKRNLGPNSRGPYLWITYDGSISILYRNRVAPAVSFIKEVLHSESLTPERKLYGEKLGVSADALRLSMRSRYDGHEE